MGGKCQQRDRRPKRKFKDHMNYEDVFVPSKRTKDLFAPVPSNAPVTTKATTNNVGEHDGVQAV
ncbi:hypothetical protein PG994_014437 [Apiospora phragmitis]|uniref:Uncharacterized protein n=1 Tax=Apiospora phragmitis TaxID=2905665 RepID=A0ABR1T4A1_9PEZI